MTTLETTLVITLTLVLLCTAILVVPECYAACRIASRLEVLNCWTGQASQAIYQVDPITVKGQSVPGLQTSACRMLLFSQLVHDLASGLFSWFAGH